MNWNMVHHHSRIVFVLLFIWFYFVYRNNFQMLVVYMHKLNANEYCIKTGEGVSIHVVRAGAYSKEGTEGTRPPLFWPGDAKAFPSPQTF